ncbi:MAG TPA: GNAT family N-acetyltransferase [Kofleriaceae bacterium]|nr:GNAT family N-acetyltransferase [Kofleriaceae bacterium]
MAADIPVIETARLVLRAPRTADFDAAAAMWRDPIVVRHIGGRPSTREEVWGRILRYLGHWAALGHGFWAIEERGGRFVGECGFADFHRELEPGFGDTPEAGWALASWAHGKGYAREAVEAALAWGDANLPGDRVVCMIDPGNIASLRLAARVGFVETAQATYKGDPTLLFERRRPRP